MMLILAKVVGAAFLSFGGAQSAGDSCCPGCCDCCSGGCCGGACPCCAGGCCCE